MVKAQLMCGGEECASMYNTMETTTAESRNLDFGKVFSEVGTDKKEEENNHMEANFWIEIAH